MSPGWKLCRSDGSPFMHHNALQVMVKHQTDEEDWRGHIDQREGGTKRDARSIDAVHEKGKVSKGQCTDLRRQKQVAYQS